MTLLEADAFISKRNSSMKDNVQTGEKFLSAICSADCRCGSGWMNCSGPTFPLACGMLGIAGSALPKRDFTMLATELLEPFEVYKRYCRADDGIL